MKRKAKKKAVVVVEPEESEIILGLGMISQDDDDENRDSTKKILSNSSEFSEQEEEEEDDQLPPDDDDEKLLIEEEELPFYLELIKRFNSSAMEKSQTNEFKREKRKKRVIELVDEGDDVIFDPLETKTEVTEEEGTPEENDGLNELGEEIGKGDDEVLEESIDKKSDIKCVNPEVYPDAGAKLPECPQCQLVFKTVADYKRHMATTHKELSYKCDVCSKHFTTPVILRQHQRNHGPKEFKCSVCGAAFPFAAGLRRHVLVHTKEKAFACTFCTMTFTQDNHLNRHLLTHTQFTPFECITCGKKFKRKPGLVRHCRLLTHVS